MDDEQVAEKVTEYLQRKGIGDDRRNAAAAMDVINPIAAFFRSDDPTKYKEAYNRLRNWVYGSLDLYKPELLRVLYPVFVHSYMDLVAKGHAQEARAFFQIFRHDHEPENLKDLQILEGVISPHHLKENELACTLRESKVSIKMCQYSFELLMQHLDSSKSMPMLGMINSHINLSVHPGQPLGDEEDDVALPGKVLAAVESTSQKKVHWGILEDSLEDKYEKELAAEAEKVAEMEKDAEAEEAKKRAEGKAPPAKKLKKDKAGKGQKPEALTRPRIRPTLTMPMLTDSFENQALDDIRHRVKLSSTSLPSVSFYTFFNTLNSLNCASISSEGAYLVGGFSDSSLKLWDMVKMGTPSMYADGKASSYFRLVGHSGPVYGVDFSPDGEFLLSASGDCTIRLWSTSMTTNLVCYKGHNFPVWDVQYSPVGHYFASASCDRTARVWCMDRLQPLRIMAGHLSDVDCVQWHANCNYIATGSSDKTVRLWDVQSGECVRVFTGHKSMVLSLAMSPDGRFMASGDEDGAIMMWDLPSGRCVTPLMGHSQCVWSLAFSGEGSILASGSADNTVRLWDVNGSAKANVEKAGARRLRLIKTLPTKSTPVYALRFSRRNLLFAAGAFTG